MTPEERRERLVELARLPADADACPDIRKVFLPLPRHGLALRPENFIIRGDRGAGKTALFNFLAASREAPGLLARVFPDAMLERVIWVDGFSANSSRHPAPEVMEHAPPSDERAMRVFWSAHLAGRLIEDGHGEVSTLDALHGVWREGRNDVLAWSDAASHHLPALMSWFDRLDGRLSAPLCVTYDHLDRIALKDPSLRQRYVEGLLALWASLGLRYRFLRPKIFLREDIFQTSLVSFADASKLRARSLSLDWDKEALFRALVRHAANLHPGLRSWIQRGARRLPLGEDPDLGWMPPALPEFGRVSQKAFVDHLAGEVMGDGAKKGYTSRWIPNRLQDANIRVVPRSLINLMAGAADHALSTGARATHERLLTPVDLVAGLKTTSDSRVAELFEEYKFVARMKNLEGRSVLMDRHDVEKILARPRPDVPDGLGTDGERVVDELIRIGVLSVRSAGRIDVPDIYRYGLGIKRKGGVSHPS